MNLLLIISLIGLCFARIGIYYLSEFIMQTEKERSCQENQDKKRQWPPNFFFK